MKSQQLEPQTTRAETKNNSTDLPPAFGVLHMTLFNKGTRVQNETKTSQVQLNSCWDEGYRKGASVIFSYHSTTNYQIPVRQ